MNIKVTPQFYSFWRVLFAGSLVISKFIKTIKIHQNPSTSSKSIKTKQNQSKSMNIYQNHIASIKINPNRTYINQHLQCARALHFYMYSVWSFHMFDSIIDILIMT